MESTAGSVVVISGEAGAADQESAARSQGLYVLIVDPRFARLFAFEARLHRAVGMPVLEQGCLNRRLRDDR